MAERQVRFFEVVNKYRQRLPSDLPFEDLRNGIRGLVDKDSYVELLNFEVLGSAYDPPRGAGARPQVPMIALDRITRDVRLRIERRRNYRPLALAQDETLAEPTFYSLLPNNVLAVMRNSGSAPSHASFRDYINTLGFLDDEIEVQPLADPNALAALRDVDVLNSVELAVGPEVALSVFDAAPGFRATVAAVREGVGRVEVKLALTMKPLDVDTNAQRRDELEAVVTGSGNIAHLSRARMSYKSLEDGRAHGYDFISEAVAQTENVDLGDSNQPTEPSAAAALAEAYDRLYDKINNALRSTG